MKTRCITMRLSIFNGVHELMKSNEISRILFVRNMEQHTMRIEPMFEDGTPIENCCLMIMEDSE